MPNCSKCNTYNITGIRDCKKCGSVLPVNYGDGCSRCGKDTGIFAKTCRHCGWNLSKNYKSSKGWWIILVVVLIIIGIKLII